MADIDKITASNGTTYNIKDSTARESIYRALDGGDLNNVFAPGFYYIAGNAPSNVPDDGTMTYTHMLVIGNAVNPASSAAVCTQILFKTGSSVSNIYVRNYSGSPRSWSSWKKFTGSALA